MDAGRPEEGLALLKQMEADDPSFRSVHYALGIVYWEGGDCKNSLQEYRQEATLRGKNDVVREIEAQQSALAAGGTQDLFQ